MYSNVSILVNKLKWKLASGDMMKKSRNINYIILAVIVIGIVTFVAFRRPLKFTCQNYTTNVKTVSLSQVKELSPEILKDEKVSEIKSKESINHLPMCNRTSEIIDKYGKFKLQNIRLLSANWNLLLNNLNKVNNGQWAVSDCRNSDQKVAILIPIRNRESHLRQVLLVLHHLMQISRIQYRIFVIEQLGNIRFNRAALFNVGFQQVQKLFPQYDCFIFHDVDLIPISIQTVTYQCSHSPKQFVGQSKAIPFYPEFFGGVTAFTREQFISVNGFSNSYFGWGGEDDDLFKRVRNKELGFDRNIFRHYVMLSHKSDKGNEPNDNRDYLLSKAAMHQPNDGLNSMEVQPHSIINANLFILIRVELNHDFVIKTLRKIDIIC